jgi:hypothetical protein
MKYAVEMGSDDMIGTQNFLKIGTGGQAILRYCLSNLKSSNVGITDGEIYEASR